MSQAEVLPERGEEQRSVSLVLHLYDITAEDQHGEEKEGEARAAEDEWLVEEGAEGGEEEEEGRAAGPSTGAGGASQAAQG